MQHIVQATKQHLFSARLRRYSQPNTTALHVLSLSHVSLALKYEPGSTAMRTKHALIDYTMVLFHHLNDKFDMSQAVVTMHDSMHYIPGIIHSPSMIPCPLLKLCVFFSEKRCYWA
jgi:hypothetical protein